MSHDTVRMQAFRDELEKISGEMQGYTRIGRKPISIETMLSNESLITGLPDDFVKSAGARAAKALALMGAGAVTGLTARQVNEDRRLGRLVRKQQEAQRQQ